MSHQWDGDPRRNPASITEATISASLLSDPQACRRQIRPSLALAPERFGRVHRRSARRASDSCADRPSGEPDPGRRVLLQRLGVQQSSPQDLTAAAVVIGVTTRRRPQQSGAASFIFMEDAERSFRLGAGPRLREGASPNARGAYSGVRKFVPARVWLFFAYQAPWVETADRDGVAMAILCMRGDFADFDAVDRRGRAARDLGSKGLERG